MVMIGGVVGSVLLIVVVIAGIAFRKTNKAFRLESGIFPELLFWLSVVSIGWVGLYGILKSF
jgi:site-specific recombinase